MKLIALAVIAAVSALSFHASAAAQQVQRAPFDVTHYQIDAVLVPAEERLNATADVTFTPLEDTRTVTFELNGSLKIESIGRVAAGAATTAPAAGRAQRNATAIAAAQNQVTFVQDQVGVSDLGPSVLLDGVRALSARPKSRGDGNSGEGAGVAPRPRPPGGTGGAFVERR